VVKRLAEGKLDAKLLTAAEIALLGYVKKVTEAAYKTTADDVVELRRHGWSDDQVAEGVYITAMFAFFNRVADAFGIPSMGYL
jgi:alkylhydroperoxidase family enzyme